MHRLFPALFSLALFCHVAAAATLHHTYDTPVAHPFGWVQTQARAPPAATIHLHFLLKQSNVPELLARLEQISEPSSSLYGQHMTNHQVQQLTAPSTTALFTTRQAGAITLMDDEDEVGEDEDADEDEDDGSGGSGGSGGADDAAVASDSDDSAGSAFDYE